jgi:hypothetical protein
MGMRRKRRTHCQIVLDVLGDRRWHTSSEIEQAQPMRVNSRVAELRRRGYLIEHKHLGGVPEGTAAHAYRLAATPESQALARPLEGNAPESRLGDAPARQSTGGAGGPGHTGALAGGGSSSADDVDASPAVEEHRATRAEDAGSTPAPRSRSRLMEPPVERAPAGGSPRNADEIVWLLDHHASLAELTWDELLAAPEYEQGSLLEEVE